MTDRDLRRSMQGRNYRGGDMGDGFPPPNELYLYIVLYIVLQSIVKDTFKYFYFFFKCVLSF